MIIPSSRPLLSLALVLSLSAVPFLRAAESVATQAAPSMASPKKRYATHFAAPTSVDCAQVLPTPPAPDTLSGRSDLEAVLQAQAWRTPEHIAWAKRVDKNDAFMAADVLGAWFTRENLPKTAALLKAVDEDRHEITEVAKQLFARARPWVVDPKVQPCVPKPSNDSYPSGHATSIFTRAEILALIFPAKRAELLEFAHRAVWGRVYAGVHYPSDLIGGLILAEPIAREIEKSPAFQKRLQEVRDEVARFMPKSTG